MDVYKKHVSRVAITKSTTRYKSALRSNYTLQNMLFETTIKHMFNSIATGLTTIILYINTENQVYTKYCVYIYF